MLSVSLANSASRRNDSWRHIAFASFTLLLTSGVTLLTGCGLGTLSPNTVALDPINVAAGATGLVHGGQQPVTNAVIQLYAAGKSTGYGQGSTALLTGAPVLTTRFGNFTLPAYTCPTGDAQVFITATGGNPGLNPPSTNNSALVLMAALGSCNTLQANASTTFIDIDEVTTVAGAFSLQQFSLPATSGNGITVGAPSANQVGLNNAFATVNNLVNTSNGTALATTPAYAAAPVQYFNQSIVPQARINTLANILAACVNTAGPTSTACTTLLTNATPAAGTAPVDTLQAALDIALNPGRNVSALYSLASPTAPFQPEISSTPNDFVLALEFTGAGLGGIPSGSTNTAGSIKQNQLAIDADQNIWVTAYGSVSGSSVSGSGFLAEFNNLGTPLSPASSQAAPNRINYGGFKTAGTGNILEPDYIAFDQSDNSWVTDDQNPEINSFSTTATPIHSGGINITAAGKANGLAIDSLGDVWIAGNNSDIAELSNSGSFLSPPAGYPGGPTNPPLFTDPRYLVFDTSNNLWSSDFGAGLGDIYLIDASNGASNGNVTADYVNGTNPTSLIAGRSGNIYGCQISTTTISIYNASSTSAPIGNFPTTTGRGCSASEAVDGFGNLWVSNGANAASKAAGLDVYGPTGALLSPVSLGYTASSVNEPTTYFSYNNGGVTISSTRGMAFDNSGNLWVLTGGTNQTVSFNTLVQVIGVAGPVVTPLSTALANGQIGVRP